VLTVGSRLACELCAISEVALIAKFNFGSTIHILGYPGALHYQFCTG
jgi:hypothetical protein